MIATKRKKNQRVFDLVRSVEFLTLLKDHSVEDIANHFSVTVRAVQYTIKKYHAYSDEQIENAISKLRRKLYHDSDYPPRDYEQQDKCEHHDCTVFLKCKCTLTLGEKDLDRVIDILLKKREYLRAHKPREILL